VTTVTVAGVDLSGPSNVRGTCVVVLRCHGDSAVYVQHLPVAGDPEILKLITELTGDTSVVVGLDAPLSYQPGGGLRERDRSLRERVVKWGIRHGAVMPPTCNRMATSRSAVWASRGSLAHWIQSGYRSSRSTREPPLAFGKLHWDRCWHSRRSQNTVPCYWIGSQPRASNRYRAPSRAIISWPPRALRSQHGCGGGGILFGSHRPSHHFIRSLSLARIAGEAGVWAASLSGTRADLADVATERKQREHAR
jgi:hypothetical protein